MKRWNRGSSPPWGNVTKRKERNDRQALYGTKKCQRLHGHATLNVQELYCMMSKLRLQYMIMREIHTRIGLFKDVTTHAS